jgi:GTPase
MTKHSEQLQIALIGKPNVGKSTLFNRLCRKKLAIVCSQPGTTRDYKKYKASLYDLDFVAIDTAGWDNVLHRTNTNKKLNKNNHAHNVQTPQMLDLILTQTQNAINIADVILFLIDGRCELTSDDITLLEVTRRSNKPAILVVNKNDGKMILQDSEIYKLGGGISEPIYVSALQGHGMEELYEALNPYKKDFSSESHTTSDHIKTQNTNITEVKEDNDSYNAQDKDDTNPDNTNKTTNSDISLAIVGRPNVGKSTLFNALIGIERAIITDTPGTTRDCFEEKSEVSGQQLTIIDTAGIRRTGKISDEIENQSVGQSITAIRRSNVVLLLIDATDIIKNQDTATAKIAINEGKTIILVVNKIDLVQDKTTLQKTMKEFTSYNFPKIYAVPIIYISAEKKRGIRSLTQKILDRYNAWQQHFTTRALNKWLEDATQKHTPPLTSAGKRLKLKYITQKTNKPPTFIIFANIPAKLPPSYLQYLRRSIAKHFDLQGIPVRLVLQGSDNPYVKRKK